MSQCINPYCYQQNPDELEICQECNTPLILGGRFRAMRLLREAQGNQTDIYEAINIENGALKILKVLPDLKTPKKLIELFQREAQALEQLQHPKIPSVDFYGSFELRLPLPNDSTKLYCLAMERIEGQNLSTWLNQGHKLNTSLAMDWYKQLCEILQFVHTNDYIHRDIKPSNIILKGNGELCLIDFGSCRKISSLTYLLKVSTREEEGRLPGATDVTALISAGYTPYEQVRGKAVLQSDFFALGRTMVHLITGNHPAQMLKPGNSDQLSWQNYAKHVDKPLLDYIDKMMDFSVLKRPRNAQEILIFITKKLPKQIRNNRIISSPIFGVGFFIAFLFSLVALNRTISYIQYKYYFSIGKESLIEKKEFKKAKSNFEQALVFYPNEIELYNYLALSCESLGDNQCAVDIYNKIVSMHPNWKTYFNFGSHYDGQFQSKTNNYSLAKKYYYESIRLSGRKQAQPLNSLARINILEGDLTNAQKLISDGLKVVDNSNTKMALLKNAGWLALKKRQYSVAETVLTQASKFPKERTDVYCLLAQAAEGLKESSRAKVWWKACTQLNSEDAASPEVFKWRAMIYDRLFKILPVE
jgi:serine/threonine protein kinase